MATYVVETYLPRARAGDLRSLTDRLARAILVRHLYSYFVAEEETAFHVIEGTSADAVRDAVERAGLRADRVIAAEPIRPAD